MIRQEARASGASTTISCRAGRGAEKHTLLIQARAGPVCRILWYESSFKTSISDKQKLNELNERANATAEIHLRYELRRQWRLVEVPQGIYQLQDFLLPLISVLHCRIYSTLSRISNKRFLLFYIVGSASSLMKEDFLKIRCSAFWIFCRGYQKERRKDDEKAVGIAGALNSCHHIECNLSPRSRLCSCLHPCHFQALTLFLKVCAFFRCHFPFLSGKVVPWVELNELWFRLARGPCSTICTPSTINQAVQDEKEHCEQVVVGGKMSKNCSKKSSPSPSLPKLCSSLN